MSGSESGKIDEGNDSTGKAEEPGADFGTGNKGTGNKGTGNKETGFQLGVFLAPYRSRRYVVAHSIFAVTALILAFIPLFNLLGYEFSLVMAILASVVLGPVTVYGVRALRGNDDGSDDVNPWSEEESPKQKPHEKKPQEKKPQEEKLSGPESRDLRDSDGESRIQPDEGTPAAKPCSPGPLDTFFRLFILNLGVLVPALVIITLNSLRVRNCDYPGGLAAFLALPVISTAWVTLVGMVAGSLLKRRWLANLLYFALFLASVVGTLAYLALEPPIVAVNPWIGYFAGSLYDEALAIPLPLVWYRALQILLMIALLSAMQLAWHIRRGERVPAGLRAICAAAVIGVVVGHAHHGELGYTMTREIIQEELGGIHETEHFTIYYSSSGDWPQRIERIAEDHEFRYWQMSQFFGNEPSGKHVTSYVYPNREAKGRLMGARRTLVAKLWLGEMHITYNGFGDDLLSHELSHLFTEPFGTGPLNLSTTAWVFPNMGLVEGIASAAQWSGEEMTPHGWSAAMHRLELAPDIAVILGAGGFWARQSRTVYTLMGSFVRWLVDTRGIDKFKKAYGHGEIEAVYGESLEDLVAEWRAFLDQIELSDSALALAEYRFDRPSIFGKLCARNIAERKRVVGELSAAGRHRDAVAAMEDVVELDPENPAHQHDLVKVLVKAERYAAARELTLELIEVEGIGAVRRNQLQQDLGDIYWRSGQTGKAAAIYRETLADIGLPPDFRRQLAVKGYALANEEVTPFLHDYFFAEGGNADKLALLFRARAELPDDPVISYLLGLRLYSIRRHEDAVPHLETAVAASLPGEDVSQKARFLLGETLYFTDELDAAQDLFLALESDARLEGQRARAAEWLDRITWKRGRNQTQTAVQRRAPRTPSRSSVSGTAAASWTPGNTRLSLTSSSTEQPCHVALE